VEPEEHFAQGAASTTSISGRAARRPTGHTPSTTITPPRRYHRPDAALPPQPRTRLDHRLTEVIFATRTIKPYIHLAIINDSRQLPSLPRSI